MLAYFRNQVSRILPAAPFRVFGEPFYGPTEPSAGVRGKTILNARSVRNAAGWMAASVLRLSGQIDRAHTAIFQSPSILNVYFHNPDRELFSRVIQWLIDNRYQFLSADEVQRLVDSGKPFPSGYTWISFDDGWRGNLTEVIPVVKERNFPITIFVPTEEVRRGYFWFSQAQKHVALLPEPYRTNVRRLWKVPETTRRMVLDQLFEKIPKPEREVLSTEEICRIARLPQVTIGSHSVNHAILPKCDDVLLDYELLHSKRDLELWSDRPVRYFSYPNGDHDTRTASALARAGYELAFMTGNRVMTAADPRYYLPRFSVMDNGSLTENLCHMFGIWSPVVEGMKRVVRQRS